MYQIKIIVFVFFSLLIGIFSICKAINLSLNATAYQSSSNYIPSQAGNFAYDGNVTTKWTSNAAANQWIALNLGQNCNVTSIVLKHASSCTCDPSVYNLKNYQIQTASSFNGPWITKGSFSNVSQSAITTHSVSFTAQYVRLFVTNSGTDLHVRLPEFEIHGSYVSSSFPSNLQVISPTCSDGNAYFSWVGSGSGWMIDISKTVNGHFDPNNFYNKSISNSTSSTGPNGFTSYLINGQLNTSQSLIFVPGQWYSWRIWNGTSHIYGPTFAAPVCNQQSGTCKNIYGIHFWESSAANIMNGKKGWTVEIVNTEDGQSGGWGINNMKNLVQQIRNQGIFEPIIRINKNWGKTIPNNPVDFSGFANDCKNIVLQLSASPYNVKWFIIGNEPNLAAENSANPGNNEKGIPADVYAACFKQCYNLIKPAAPNVKLLVAGPGTFNNQGPLSNSSGPGVYYDVYFERVVTQVGNLNDGYAIHAYGLTNTQSPDNNLQPVYQNSNAWEFDCFKVQMAILAKYPYSKTKAVHITETNTNSHGNQPSSSYHSGWMQQAFARINQWNQTPGNQQIQSLCWFVYKDYGGWGNYSLLTQNGNMGQARSDFNLLTANTNYKPANCPGQFASHSNVASKINPEENISCIVSIPNYAQVITSSGTLLNGGEFAWGCPGATVISQMGADTIFLENNDTCISNGGGTVIYAKNGSVVMLYGGFEIVYHEPGVIVNDISGNALAIIGCSTLIYDYTNAPVPGCSGVEVEEQTMQNQIAIYPNPATDILNIIVPYHQKSNPPVILVYDYLGNAIRSSSASFTSGYSTFQVNVGNFKKGVYLCVISYGDKYIAKRFTVQ